MNKIIVSGRRLGRAWVVGAVLSLCVLPGAWAAMYKWVDENGQVQYSQTPPPAAQFKELKAPPPPPSSAAESQKQLQDLLERQADSQARREADKQDKSEEARKREEMARRCEQAKGQRTLLENTPPNRVTVEGADGTIHRLTEEEHASHLAQVKKIISEACAGNP